ncbi:flavin reductase family protein [Cutibacterium sp.]|uniref:flavin reductase family protein n=1 Tax=Cutibacterium sp. TaxID=1912221 RepID=UPI0026DB87D3|nr:flavin reductase family protein [Cutibacterium sp.]MDO4412263.1 flavin reductase family protein [Cutibacterium sp.]
MTGNTTDELGSDLDGLGSDLATAFRGHPAGVAILTTMGAAGPEGLTVSSLASVSITPAVVSVSLGNGSTTLAALDEGSRVIVHMLDADRIDVADAFAAPGTDHFAGTEWIPSSEGAPQLTIPGPVLHGFVQTMTDTGSATLIAITVDRITIGNRRAPGLVRMARGWHEIPR